MTPRLWAYGIAAVLVLAALWTFSAPFRSLFDFLNDREAVGDYKAETRAKVTGKVLEAERSANRNDAERRVVRERQTDELERAREEAVRADPQAGGQMAGPAVRAVLDRLRTQQAQRADTSSE